MSTIEKIRRRVEKADQLLGASASQNRKYAQRLTRLLDQLEIEHEGRRVRTERLHLENDELRAMLLSLLLGIEAEGDLDHVLQGMGTRMTALVDAAKNGGPELITHTAVVIEGTVDSETGQVLAPGTNAPGGRLTLHQALAQLMELVADTEDLPITASKLSSIRSPAIAEAVRLLRAAVSEGEDPIAAEPVAVARPEIGSDAPELENQDPVDMDAADIDAIDFDSVEPESASEDPVDMDAADIDPMDFDAVATDTAEVPEGSG